MIVLEQLETPGLGAEIDGEKFVSQFRGLATRPPISYVKGKAPEKDNEVQAITGATISSKAVVDIINKTIKQWMGLR
jgi:electron transport complex protein RnfG